MPNPDTPIPPFFAVRPGFLLRFGMLSLKSGSATKFSQATLGCKAARTAVARLSKNHPIDDRCVPRWCVSVNVVGRAHPFSRRSGSECEPCIGFDLAGTIEGKAAGELRPAASHASGQAVLACCTRADKRRLPPRTSVGSGDRSLQPRFLAAKPARSYPFRSGSTGLLKTSGNNRYDCASLHCAHFPEVFSEKPSRRCASNESSCLSRC